MAGRHTGRRVVPHPQSESQRHLSLEETLDHGLRDHGELIPKSRLLPLQRKIDELERALGRKALEVDILKKFCELKDLRLPEGM